MLSVVLRKRPGIQRIYASLILPRCVNRRRGSCNLASVRHCNREACDFNSRLKQFCRRSRHVFFLDHALEWFPPRRVLAADGVHPSYEGVTVMATHIKYLALRHAPYASASAWYDHSPNHQSQHVTPVRSLPAPEQLASEPSAHGPDLQGPSTRGNATSQPQRQRRRSTKRCGSAPSSHQYALRSASRAYTAAVPKD
ncbi:hypothetical protein HPB50_003523 [Hyalomma asiaticum]|uniref:Uncharacterized protein n=1 Tax=Hyalomma asiaticum TaxID=266040 RepID=A0ACB7SS27_HYAAI|nr:hypothetical protein HPB50_003523 [Hyalomma asiaticum]